MKDNEDCALPYWAIGRSSELVIGSRLFTLDGRKIGNACIFDVCEDRNEAFLFSVLTDDGSLHGLYRSEIEDYFHAPEYTIDPDTCPGSAHSGLSF